MSEKYNVLWIDDEHASMKALHKTAVDFDITLFPFKSMNGGCSEFENNSTKYDAVLFDAKFFENESDQPGSEDTKWVHQAKDRIRDIDKSLSFFVLTGQAEAYDSREFKNAFPHVFSKGVGKDEDELFKMLVDACKNRELTRLKHKYPNQFEICTNEYIGAKHFERMLGLIKDIENPESIKVAQDMLNPMRKIMEALFDKLNEIGLIPDTITKEQGGINGSSYFLSGHNSSYEYHSELIHPMVAENIYRLLNITQDGSHDDGLKFRADKYLSSSKNHNLYKSTIYLLLDILDYMQPFIDGNNNKEKNQSKWEMIQSKSFSFNEWIPGNISRIADNNYGTFQSEEGGNTLTITPENILKHSLIENQNIQVTTKPSPCGTRTYINEIRVTE